MTTMDILFRYGAQPSEAVLLALSGAREVYGIRRLNFDREKQTVLVEYDATRLSGPVVASLMRRAGLDVVEEMSLIPPPPPQPPATPPTTAA
jgi:hypothetical protein